MALIHCEDCGKEYSDLAKACPQCGRPNPNIAQPVDVRTHKGHWSAGRLAIGILSILLFIFVSFQSCAVGLGEALGSEGTSSANGTIVAICFLVCGIVGIATRNSKSKIGPIITTVLYWLGALMTVGTGTTYADLPLWGALCFAFGVVYLICSIKTKK